MPDGQVLEFSGVTKRFGGVTAVSGLSARVEPGVVTGFLGPNGAGKTTSLRILLGLVRATSGTATIGGVSYAKLRHPLQSVGAVLEASSFHPGRPAANHLKVYAQAAGLPLSRVDEALGTVGLAEVAGRKVGGYSLGMRQRLGLAYALLGDPGVLVLDEPANGLDPEGIRWMRGLLRQLARQGRTVLVSSHLLAEVQQTVDALLIISQGRLVFQGGLDELTDPSEYVTVVDSVDRAGLSAALQQAGMDFEVLRSGLTVRGGDTVDVGRAAAAAGIALSTLQRRGPGLEEVFLDLVNGARVHPSAGDVPPAPPGAPTVEAPVAEEAPEAVAEETVALGDAPEETDAAEDAPEAVAEETPEVAVEEVAAEEAVAVEDAPEATADETAAAPAEPGAPHAAFAVASTGIIEVIPEDEAAAAADTPPSNDASPDDTAEDPADPRDATDDDATGDDDEPDDGGSRVWAMPAGSHDEPADDADPAPEDASADRVEEERTDADADADRFFASFDGQPAPEGGPSAPGDVPPSADGEEDSSADDGEPTASDPPSDADTGSAEHEGGEQR